MATAKDPLQVVDETGEQVDGLAGLSALRECDGDVVAVAERVGVLRAE